MHDALDLLQSLGDAQVTRLLALGVERQVIAGTRLIDEGSEPDAVWFVLEGLVEVTTAATPARPIARLGPGEVFGEVAFLERAAASASVTAIENSLLLEVPRTQLADALAGDGAFAGELHLALARILSRRLRATTRALLGSTLPADDAGASTTWQALSGRIDGLKAALIDADQAAAKNGGELPAERGHRIVAEFSAFAAELDERIGDRSGLGESERNLLGSRVQRELLPFALQSELGDRMFTKPRGYAGDYLTIDIMYADRPSGTGRLGPTLDRAFREQPANRAVVNRRALLADEIARSMAERAGSDRTFVTSLASGPAAELFDVFTGLDDTGRLKATCIDIDFQALGFVADRAERLRLSRCFELHSGNLVYLAMGRKQLAMPPQDLIYSIGLIDYFADKFVRMLLDWIHDRLRPGGRVLLGNFHPRNPSKALMDHVFDWRLIHRTEQDMDRLFAASKFGRPSTRIRFEPAGVNMFAECVKSV